MNIYAPIATLILGVAVAGLATPGYTAAAGTKIQISHKEHVGNYLADAHGKTLYLFEKDERGKSACYDACARAWPPLLSDGSPVAGRGVDKRKLSTVKRTDGSLQVTYAGWPLYYFVKDDEAGDAYGQEVNGFGGEWYMVSPAGTKAEAKEGGKHEQKKSSGW
jgi:predicted lipoprotein with Yx(FWY)xxD motif